MCSQFAQVECSAVHITFHQPRGPGHGQRGGEVPQVNPAADHGLGPPQGQTGHVVQVRAEGAQFGSGERIVGGEPFVQRGIHQIMPGIGEGRRGGRAHWRSIEGEQAARAGIGFVQGRKPQETFHGFSTPHQPDAQAPDREPPGEGSRAVQGVDHPTPLGAGEDGFAFLFGDHAILRSMGGQGLQHQLGGFPVQTGHRRAVGLGLGLGAYLAEGAQRRLVVGAENGPYDGPVRGVGGKRLVHGVLGGAGRGMGGGAPRRKVPGLCRNDAFATGPPGAGAGSTAGQSPNSAGPRFFGPRSFNRRSFNRRSFNRRSFNRRWFGPRPSSSPAGSRFTGIACIPWGNPETGIPDWPESEIPGPDISCPDCRSCPCFP